MLLLGRKDPESTGVLLFMVFLQQAAPLSTRRVRGEHLYIATAMYIA